MKTVASLLILAATLLTLAAPSPAGQPRAELMDRLVRVHHTRGAGLASSALSETRPAARIRALREAADRLRRAHRLARLLRGDDAESIRTAVAADLVRVANALARENLRRGSLPRARSWNALALRHDPANAGALNLARDIATAESADLYDEVRGRTAIERIRERRRAAGLPLRDRGIARRR